MPYRLTPRLLVKAKGDDFLPWRKENLVERMKQNERNKIYNKSTKLNDEDRTILAGLLVKAGYAVRTGSETFPGKKQKTYYVEFWEE